jgi:predicted small lipoprotein YifL
MRAAALALGLALVLAACGKKGDPVRPSAEPERPSVTREAPDTEEGEAE